jgi:hypothetical protein
VGISPFARAAANNGFGSKYLYPSSAAFALM